jgi:polar amino acid transport system substrate-binding protein
VGQLTVQLLKANGCRVFGVDLDETRIKLALAAGADDGCTPTDAATRVKSWSRGRGADACIITAATSSNEPVELAGEISRLRGRVVAVGMIGMNVPRNVYYQRELTLKVSLSYGPGRYDPNYEERGHDYPVAYVRWTEARNLEAFLDLLSLERIDVKPLVTHRFSIAEATRGYELISGGSSEPYLAVLLTYDTEGEMSRTVENLAAKKPLTPSASVRVGMIGAGAYAQKMLLPHFKTAGVEFCSIASASGVSARDVGTKFGFPRFVSDAASVIDDDETNLVMVATRHGSHAALAIEALGRGKHVFLEKPLALNDAELDGLLEAANASAGQLFVGFNRRFSPLAIRAKEVFAQRNAPLSILYRVNAGHVPREHWTQDEKEGGGRIIGEICHFIDLMQFLTGAVPQRVYAESISAGSAAIVKEDSVVITLRFSDGSAGMVAYVSEGDAALRKEYIEIFGEGKVFVIDDFLTATLFTQGKEKRETLRAQDKGQAEQARIVCAAIEKGQPAPITLRELEATTRATFRIRDSLRTGKPKIISNE